jgi:hypothetical protein
MITVWAARVEARPLILLKFYIRKESMEIVQELGVHSCKKQGTLFEGPICRVEMTSGSVLLINATVQELEARSA